MIKNACRVGATNLFSATIHNQLNILDTLMDISSLTFDTCPQGTPAGSSYADIAVTLVQLTQTNNNAIFSSSTDFDSFFSNASTGDQLEVAASISSWDTESFTLEYKVGMAAETQEEVDMRTSETVLITMMKDCDFTMPTIISDSTFGDTRTYVRTYSPVTLTFTGS